MTVALSGRRDFTQEQQNFAVEQGVVSRADVIIRAWEAGENLIKRTIGTIKDVKEQGVSYDSQIRILKEESTKLTLMFDQIKEILIKEPTCCGIKQSSILSWGTSLVGVASSAAGVGTMAYDYISSKAPTLAPLLLSAGGVVIGGFQFIVLNRLKLQQEERTKLLVIRGRCEIITQAQEMATILELLMRKSHPRSGMPKEADADKVRLLRKQMQIVRHRISVVPQEVAEVAPRARQASPSSKMKKKQFSARELIVNEQIAAPCAFESLSHSDDGHSAKKETMDHEEVKVAGAVLSGDFSEEKVSEESSVIDIFEEGLEPLPMRQVARDDGEV